MLLPLLVAACSFLVPGCKKINPATSSSSLSSLAQQTGTDGLRDSLAFIARRYYLWNSNIPASFQAHSYSSSDTLNAELAAIKSFSPLDAVTGIHYDHFSFILTQADFKSEFPVSLATAVNATATYGMKYAFDINGNLRISYAAHASRAYQQGVRRSWQIMSINSVKVATDAASISSLNAALNAPSATFEFRTPAGSTVTLSLTRVTLVDDEVITTKIFPQGSKKVGYIAYNTFLVPLDNNGNITHKGLDTAFQKLKAAGITDLIIDLRYNGGGYTTIAEEMDNALIPAAYDKKVLYTERYNDTLNKYYKLGNKSLDHDVTVNINKSAAGNPTALGVNSLVFIVSNSTASAAELVINNLYPYFNNIKLIGLGKGLQTQYANTAGKPFGYAGSFGIPTKNPVYQAFVINFETRNANGVGGYESGLVPDLQVYDGVDYDWGDPQEDGLQAALNYQRTGTLAYASPHNQLSAGAHTQSAGSYGIQLNSLIHEPGFQAMIKTSPLIRSRELHGTATKSLLKKP